MSVMVGRPLPDFLADVECELRTTAAALGHTRDGVLKGESMHVGTACRKCDVIRLADEAADRAALLVTEGVAR